MEDKIYDLSKCEISDRNGSYGGKSGKKEGILIDGEYWIIKYPKNASAMQTNISYVLSPLSEHLGSRIFDILGYPVHETMLGIRNDKIVVACKDFRPNGAELREIRKIKNIFCEKIDELKDYGESPEGEEHYSGLYSTITHLEKNPVLSQVPGIKERFWEQAIIDGFINNNDRNNENWGLLFENGRYSIAPVYDNGASFYGKHTDELMFSKLQNGGIVETALTCRTPYLINEKEITFQKLLHLEDPALERAIVNVSDRIGEKMNDIKNLIDSIPSYYKNTPVCSDIRKEFYFESLEIRYDQLIRPLALQLRNIRDAELIKGKEFGRGEGYGTELQ